MKVKCNRCGKKSIVKTSGLNRRKVTRLTYLCRACAARLRSLTKHAHDLSPQRKLERFAAVYRRFNRRKVN